MWRSELFQCLRVVFKAEVSILTVNLSNLTLNLLKSLRQVYLSCTLWFPGPHEKQTFKKRPLWDVQGDPAGVPRSPAAGLILAWISHIWLHCLTCESPGSPSETQQRGCSASRCGPPGSLQQHMSKWTWSGEHTPPAHLHNGLSLSADVVRLWNSMCASSMMSACVYVCSGVFKQGVHGTWKCACVPVVQQMTHYGLLVICPGTHKSRGQVVSDAMCFYGPLSYVHSEREAGGALPVYQVHLHCRELRHNQLSSTPFFLQILPKSSWSLFFLFFFQICVHIGEPNP